MPGHAVSGDRTHDLRVMRPTLYQLRYFRSVCAWLDRGSTSRLPSPARQRNAISQSGGPLGHTTRCSDRRCSRLNKARKRASAGNRTQITSMATMYSTTRPMMLVKFSIGPGTWRVRASRVYQFIRIVFLAKRRPRCGIVYLANTRPPRITMFSSAAPARELARAAVR